MEKKSSSNKENVRDGLQEGDEVNLVVTEETKLGFIVTINNDREGLLYHNELFESLSPGDKRKGFVKHIRPDGKIDVTLQQQGYDHIDKIKYTILERINANGGKLPFGDKSQPEEIYQHLHISKKVFKKVIGALYREKLITISDFEIKEVQ